MTPERHGDSDSSPGLVEQRLMSSRRCGQIGDIGSVISRQRDEYRTHSSGYFIFHDDYDEERGQKKQDLVH